MDGISLLLMSIIAVGVAAYFGIAWDLETKADPREPPAVTTAVPYVGHAIGIMRSKFNYYVQLRYVRSQPTLMIASHGAQSQQCLLPIYTMAMPGQKMYIITTPELIQAVQKLPKALAFPPIEAKFASKVCGSSAEAHKILMKNVNGDEGDWGLSMESYAAMRAALAPGQGLDQMNRTMIQNISASLDGLIPCGEKKKNMGLAKWLRSTITAATTNSVYGPKNPFKDQAVEDGFW